jgi:LuxR family maltose regulon positive regulatory protein
VSSLLLQTKLRIPRVRPGLVSRPRLIERLNEALHLGRKLTLISAPAGFGKTTLLSEWAAGWGPRTRVAWVSLDKGDNDPARFWTHFIAALQTIPEGVGEAARAALQSRGLANANAPPRAEVLLTGLISEVTAADPDPFSLVLDDFHVITVPQVNDALASLLSNLPQQMHLVLSSRADPPWPLARLRVCGELTELRTDDLRFTPTEAAAFLNDVMGLGLSAGDIAALDARTEGWIAGLQMAALSMQGRQDVTRFIKAFSGSHRFILDYLVEEVLERQSSDIQEFLLKTSILERMTAPLCDAVTDGSDSQTILIQLDRANLFLIPLDDQRSWYRYHHLFADLLRVRLEGTRPEQTRALHRQASEWYEQNGLTSEAVRHASAAGDVKRVERLVEGNAFAMMDHGELTTLAGWLDALPDEVVRSRPWLCVARAWASAYAGQLDAVEPLLQHAREALGSTEEHTDTQRMAGHIAAICAYTAYVRGNGAGTASLAREALEHLPEEDSMARGFAATMLSVSLRMSGDLASAEQAFVEATAISQAAGDSHVAVTALCDLAGLQRMQGEFHRAVATCRDALQLADEHFRRSGWQLPVVGHVYGRMSQVLYEWNDLEDAVHYSTEGIKLCEQGQLAEILADNYCYLATALQAIGDADGALGAIRQARKVASTVSRWYAFMVDAHEVGLRLAQGDVAAAAGWVEDVLGVEGQPGSQYGFKCTTLARALIAQNRLDEAWEVLALPLEDAEAAGAMSFVIKMLVLQALILQAQIKADQALAALERALSLAEPEGYVRTFVDEGKPMGELLRKAAARGIAVDYVGKLLAPLEKETKEGRRLGRALPEPMVEPLSERELEVLRLLAIHLSSTEIARELVISVNTVRTHIKNVYSKLNVHNRKDAVERAEKLDLL